MEIKNYHPDYLPEMEVLFSENFHKLRQNVPSLPDALEKPERLSAMLNDFFTTCPGVVALDGGRVVGYIAAYLVDAFRGTEHKGAYVPEWGHSAADARIYTTLYRAASAQWSAAGCGVHAISLLAHDHTAQEVWFRNGFGLTGIDAIRPMQPLESIPTQGITVRKASLADVERLLPLEAEHAHHYQQPPIFMAAYEAQDAAAFTEFITAPQNSIWIAFDGAELVGFMRFRANSFGAAEIVNAPDKIAITGAYVRPVSRGRGAAAAMLDAALRDYAAQGFARCSVDFESFNPEAFAFWQKYFQIVCLSVVRVPERPF